MTPIAILSVGGRGREQFSEKLLESIAYAARYGQQPRSEILAMTIEELEEFNGAISDIVKQENKSREN